MDVETARNLCLSLPETTEGPHFEKIAFKVEKKIFATLWPEEKTLVLKLSLEDQAEICAQHDACEPVKGSWGKKGWTTVHLSKMKRTEDFRKLLRMAWCTVASKKLQSSLK